MSRRTIPVSERSVGERAEVLADAGDARLLRIGAIHIGAAAIARLAVAVVESGPRLWILDLTGGRCRRLAVNEIDGNVARREREVIDAGAAHDRLMIVVGERVAFSKFAQI